MEKCSNISNKERKNSAQEWNNVHINAHIHKHIFANVLSYIIIVQRKERTDGHQPIYSPPPQSADQPPTHPQPRVKKNYYYFFHFDSTDKMKFSAVGFLIKENYIFFSSDWIRLKLKPRKITHFVMLACESSSSTAPLAGEMDEQDWLWGDGGGGCLKRRLLLLC